MEFEKYYSGSATTPAEQQSPSALERLKALLNERVEIRWDQKWYPGMLLGEVDGEVSFDDESFDNEFIGIGDIRRPIQSINQRPDDAVTRNAHAVVVGAFNFESFDKYVRWILSPVTECRN